MGNLDQQRAPPCQLQEPGQFSDSSRGMPMTALYMLSHYSMTQPGRCGMETIMDGFA